MANSHFKLKEKPLVICLTPVKNEAWILDRFIQCASLWADHIIIADQMSTDGSREIALKYPKVVLVDNPIVGDFDEYRMRNILFEKGREFNGEKVFIVLDADEILSNDFLESKDWMNIKSAKKGDYFSIDLINLEPNLEYYWQASRLNRIYIDDGTPYKADIIHTAHIPISPNGTYKHLSKTKIIHYQYTDWQRMQSKHRWYQCYELLTRTHLHPISIFRIYHHMYGLPISQFQPLNPEWFDFYEKKGINMFSITKESSYYWDKKVEEYFEKYGTQYFTSLNIWENATRNYPDPRNSMQKMLHRYLLWSQIYFTQKFPIGTFVRYFDKLLIWIF